MSQKVFEIIDSSNEEIYYPLGIFRSLAEAKRAINKSDTESVSPNSEDYEEIKIVERFYGWDIYRKPVYCVRRERVSFGDDSEYWTDTVIDCSKFN